MIGRNISWRLLILFLILILCIYFSRKEFYREKFVYSWGALLFDGILFGILFILYSVVGYFVTRNPRNAIDVPDFLLFPSDDVWFLGLVGLILSLITLFLIYEYLAQNNKKLGLPFDEKRILPLIIWWK